MSLLTVPLSAMTADISRETRNRSFIELDEMFQLKVSSRHFATFETSVDRAKKGETRQDA